VLSAVFMALQFLLVSPPGPPPSHSTMSASMQISFEQQRAVKAKHARSRRRMKTLFKKALELSSENDTEVYIVTFRRGRFHEFNSMQDGANQVLFPPAPSVVVRSMTLHPDLHTLICSRPGDSLLLLSARPRLGGFGVWAREKTAEACRNARGEGTASMETGMMGRPVTVRGCGPTT